MMAAALVKVGCHAEPGVLILISSINNIGNRFLS